MKGKMKNKLHAMYHKGVDAMNAGNDHEAVHTWLKAMALRESFNGHPANGGQKVIGNLCSCIDENVNPFKPATRGA